MPISEHSCCSWRSPWPLLSSDPSPSLSQLLLLVWVDLSENKKKLKKKPNPKGQKKMLCSFACEPLEGATERDLFCVEFNHPSGYLWREGSLLRFDIRSKIQSSSWPSTWLKCQWDRLVLSDSAPVAGTLVVKTVTDGIDGTICTV